MRGSESMFNVSCGETFFSLVCVASLRACAHAHTHSPGAFATMSRVLAESPLGKKGRYSQDQGKFQQVGDVTTIPCPDSCCNGYLIYKVALSGAKFCVCTNASKSGAISIGTPTGEVSSKGKPREYTLPVLLEGCIPTSIVFIASSSA